MTWERIGMWSENSEFGAALIKEHCCDMFSLTRMWSILELSVLPLTL
jgi:hypothetical protein